MTFVLCENRRSVLEAASHILVTGGPGSGKTTIALKKAMKRIEDGLEAGQIVQFLSFSRAAVARIAEASRTNIPLEKRKFLSIGTFHSFFWDILRTHGYLLGPPKKLQLLLPQDERARRDGADTETPEWIVERERLFLEEGLVAFDLFAPKVASLLQNQVIQKLVADKNPLVIVDEAQDTAEDQWACVKSLAPHSQILCLADLDQQIYEFRPGVSSERVTHIVGSLSPLAVDLGSQNNRSPGVEIVQFANDILSNTPRGSPYQGISRINFPRKAAHRDRWIRQSIGILSGKIRAQTGNAPQSIAILATWGKGVAVISRALKGTAANEEIVHQVHFDETGVLLSSRIIAFCMEPKTQVHHHENVAHVLEMMAMLFRAKGTRTALTKAADLNVWATNVRQGQMPNRKLAKKVGTLISSLEEMKFSGNPAHDWVAIRNLFSSAGIPDLRAIATDAEYLTVFNRGKLIMSGLIDLWQSQGSYLRARATLDIALAQDQILSGNGELHGINVMTIHKAKGKEFDGVIIIDEDNISPLASRRENAPHIKSRRLLRVGITRAKHHTLLLMGAFPQCPLLIGHSL